MLLLLNNSQAEPAEPPINDDFADRIRLSGASGSAGPISTRGATSEPDEPSLFATMAGLPPGLIPLASLWWELEVPDDGFYRFETSMAMSGNPGIIHLYEGDDLLTLQMMTTMTPMDIGAEVAGDWRVAYLEAGVAYKIQVYTMLMTMPPQPAIVTFTWEPAFDIPYADLTSSTSWYSSLQADDDGVVSERGVPLVHQDLTRAEQGSWFNGSTSYVLDPRQDSAAVQGNANAFDLEVWVKADQAFAERFIVRSSWYGYYLKTRSDGRLVGGWHDSGAMQYDVTSIDPITDDEWHHVRLYCKRVSSMASNEAILVIDGEVQGILATPGTPYLPAPGEYLDGVGIGRDGGFTSGYFEGSVAHLSIDLLGLTGNPTEYEQEWRRRWFEEQFQEPEPEPQVHAGVGFIPIF